MPNFSGLRPLLITVGVSVSLVGCSTTARSGSRPTRFVTIQPIQVCDSFGVDCADLATFADATFKIWSQADIQVSFLPPNRLFDSRFLVIDSRDEFSELSFAGGAGAYGRHPFSSRTSGPVNMWFVDGIVQGVVDIFGLAWIDQNGVLISDDILSFNNGRGRIDTVAHELGHNLGLRHSGLGAGSANNLMSDGGDRAVPTTISDINPDGARVSRLTDDQVNTARSSPFVTGSPTPAPSSNPVLPFPVPLPLLEDADYDAVPRLTLAALPQAPAEPAESLPVGPGSALPGVTSAEFALHSKSSQAVPEPGSLSWIGAALLLLVGRVGSQAQGGRS
ncbi:MAG TPA: zinc-dependent metalloprotease family protein [Trichocoleus sp.]